MKTHFLSSLVLVTAFDSTLSAAIIFDNSVNDLHARFEPGTLEVGDELILAGTERYLTNFSFEFWGENSADANVFAGEITARVRFYLNDGPPFNGYLTPGTVFYDSDWFPVPGPTSRSTFVFVAGSDFPAEGLYLPSSRMTWSVQFQGMGTTDSVGVDLYSPPIVGLDFIDYWERHEDWLLRTNFVSMNFAARMEASALSQAAPPLLQIAVSAGQVVLTWPTAASNFVLQTSSTLGSAATWTTITNNVTAVGTNFTFSSDVTAASTGFFRLWRERSDAQSLWP
jgi:hypothetical protein